MMVLSLIREFRFPLRYPPTHQEFPASPTNWLLRVAVTSGLVGYCQWNFGCTLACFSLVKRCLGLFRSR